MTNTMFAKLKYFRDPVIGLALLFNCSFYTVSAQYHDNIWLLGYGGGNNDTTFGISILDFANGSLVITSMPEITTNFNDTNASICNKEGQLLFYFNGISVENTDYQIMENGDTLNEWDVFGFDLPQGGLAIPYPGQSNQYVLFHSEEGYINLPDWYLESTGLYYSIIDMEQNDGLGKVVLRKVPIIIDTLEYGKITATKHANGRDYWIVINKSHSNKYYKLLLTEQGVEQINLQEVGQYTHDGLGQALFSPDGSHYVKFNGIDSETGSVLDVYDFDRCSGELSNHQKIDFPDFAGSSGAAISPDSKLLYVISSDFVFQFEFNIANIEESKQVVAIYDGFLGPFPTRFYQAQLARDGKIYFACNNGTRYLHLIERPNIRGVNCMVKQHHIELPTYNASSIPNFINYRLGPLDGSFCDTLGIDNHVLAGFRFEPDSVDPFKYYFTDLSSYNPNEWMWFVDNDYVSNEINPVLDFDSKGIYSVCLVVSNEYGSDTLCQNINIVITGMNEIEGGKDFIISPNPAHDNVSIQLNEGINKELQFVLYNIWGQEVKRTTIPKNDLIHNLDISDVSGSFYVYALMLEGQIVHSGKLVIAE